jgi:protein TonB
MWVSGNQPSFIVAGPGTFTKTTAPAFPVVPGWRPCHRSAYSDHSSRRQSFSETLSGLPGFRGMNSKKILLAATLAGGLLSTAVVSSAAVVLSDLTVNAAENSAPVPTKIVAPSGISRRFEGAVVYLRLTVDETGRPHHITLRSGEDQNLVNHLLPAVAQWKFTPAMKNGRAVPMQIELPVELVDIRSI